MTETDPVVIGKYKDHNVYLLEESGNWFVRIGEYNQKFWLKSLNNMATEKDYVFVTEDGIKVNNSFNPILEKINLLVSAL